MEIHCLHPRPYCIALYLYAHEVSAPFTPIVYCLYTPSSTATLSGRLSVLATLVGGLKNIHNASHLTRACSWLSSSPLVEESSEVDVFENRHAAQGQRATNDS